jgi:AcrR family transcriptional regulator
MAEAAAAGAGATPGPADGRRWERLGPDARRAQILRCARRLFTHRPYAGVSMEEVATAAGMRRGLVNHYFGTKRELFLAVVRDILSAFDRAFPGSAGNGTGTTPEAIVGDHVDRWLAVVEADVDAWFALVGAEGFGRDPDVEELVERSRAAMVERIVEILAGAGTFATAGDALRVVLRTYAGLAEVATREWLQHHTIDRRQTHTLLTAALLALLRDVVPAVAGASARDGSGDVRS